MEKNLFEQFELNDDRSDRVFVIAELSANHGHSFDLAAKTIRAAKAAGADAIKIQTYTADTITIDCDNPYFRINQDTLWDGTTLYKLYQEAYTPWEWQPLLKRIAEEEGLAFFSSPFDKTSVDFLEEMNVPAYKIASFEITDVPLIEYVASKGKPVIISTGIATLEDIEDALAACRRAGNSNIALLKCTSTYPAPVELANLRTIQDMKQRFRLPTGLSDHTMGSTVAITAVALGARIVEKHFILDRSIGGPDAAFSMNPEEFAQMVRGIREAEKALGSVTYELTEKVKKNRKFSRSLFVVKDMDAGDMITEENVRSIRPGDGMPPKYLPLITGKKVSCPLKAGTPLKEEYIPLFHFAFQSL
ncbi:MAG: pseudaminic acid synthase [Tannerellaceae bacterium]|jgi:pseudaminic acid synthase|nr:pseudaminic acid synthase [Tannerellaceae bacterium]